jgi:hypothetical protein
MTITINIKFSFDFSESTLVPTINKVIIPTHNKIKNIAFPPFRMGTEGKICVTNKLKIWIKKNEPIIPIATVFNEGNLYTIILFLPF